MAVILVATGGCKRAQGLCRVHGECGPFGLCSNGRCVCPSPFAGRGCDGCQSGFHRVEAGCARNERCAPDSCSGHGTCDDGSGVVSCACGPGYADPRCGSCDVEMGFHRSASGQGCTRDGCDPDPCAANQVCGSSGQCLCRFATCQGGCCEAGSVCFGDACCAPQSCAEIGKQCGSWDVGCGVFRPCASCGPQEICQVDGACGALAEVPQPGGVGLVRGSALVVATSGEEALLGFPDSSPSGKGATGAGLVLGLAPGGSGRAPQLLLAEDGMPGDLLGSAAALEKDTAILSAPGRGSPAFEQRTGGVFVFRRRADGKWVQEASLRTPEALPGSFFGCAVALGGDRALVGACFQPGPETNPVKYAGAAYVFRRQPDGRWEFEAKLVAPAPLPYDCFGQSLAFSGSQALIGAPVCPRADDPIEPRGGKVHVFREGPGRTWTRESQTLQGDALLPVDGFGETLAADGGVLVVGAPEVELQAGEVHVFRHDELRGWVREARLFPTKMKSERFGSVISIRADHILVGVKRERPLLTDKYEEQGSVYLFRHVTAGGWYQGDRVSPPAAGVELSGFGSSVAMGQGFGLASAWKRNDREWAVYRF